jgi:predicted nuclease with TOPRIM domain
VAKRGSDRRDGKRKPHEPRSGEWVRQVEVATEISRRKQEVQGRMEEVFRQYRELESEAEGLEAEFRAAVAKLAEMRRREGR